MPQAGVMLVPEFTVRVALPIVLRGLVATWLAGTFRFAFRLAGTTKLQRSGINAVGSPTFVALFGA